MKMKIQRLTEEGSIYLHGEILRFDLWHILLKDLRLAGLKRTSSQDTGDPLPTRVDNCRLDYFRLGMSSFTNPLSYFIN